MLILARNIGESIIMDGGIKITLTNIQDNQAKIGIEAPKEVKIYRKEIYERLSDYTAPPYG